MLLYLRICENIKYKYQVLALMDLVLIAEYIFEELIIYNFFVCLFGNTRDSFLNNNAIDLVGKI